MKKSLFIASLIAAFALAACKPAEQPTPETTDSAPADSDNSDAALGTDNIAPSEPEPAEIPVVPDAEKSENTEN